MKRGLASPWVHSALAITRRLRLQLSRVDQRKSLKRRAGLPVRAASSSAWISSTEISSTRRSLGASPNPEAALFFSHQAIKASRAKPESARSRMRTRGQRVRIRATIRSTSATAPAEASMLERRSLAERRAAEHVERQIAVAVVVAVEEAAFL